VAGAVLQAPGERAVTAQATAQPDAAKPAAAAEVAATVPAAAASVEGRIWPLSYPGSNGPQAEGK
jgi:hypothetical protein